MKARLGGELILLVPTAISSFSLIIHSLLHPWIAKTTSSNNPSQPPLQWRGRILTHISVLLYITKSSPSSPRRLQHTTIGLYIIFSTHTEMRPMQSVIVYLDRWSPFLKTLISRLATTLDPHRWWILRLISVCRTQMGSRRWMEAYPIYLTKSMRIR